MAKSNKPHRTSTKKQAALESLPRLRYCAQPIQHPRQFDPSVGTQRARAIINNGKKWVNGTQLTYYCYQTGSFGIAATVMVLFEITPTGNFQIADNDDSGTDLNARIAMRLLSCRQYQIDIRLYYAATAADTSIMVW